MFRIPNQLQSPTLNHEQTDKNDYLRKDFSRDKQLEGDRLFRENIMQGEIMIMLENLVRSNEITGHYKNIEPKNALEN